MTRFLIRQGNNQKGKKTIFVVFSDSYQELTLIRTGLLDDLRSLFETVLIVPSPAIRDRLISHLGSETIDIHVFRDFSLSFVQRAIDALLACKYAKYDGPFRRLRRKRLSDQYGVLKKIKHLAVGVVSKILPASMLHFIQSRIFLDHFLDALFQRYRPVLTVLSWGAVYGPGPKMVRSARKFGSKTISVDASWDCLDEFTVIPKVDRLLVWNEPMKVEAISRHRYHPGRVSVVGPLRCDFYRRQDLLVERDGYLNSLGLSPHRKLITLVVNRGEPEIYCRTALGIIQADEKQGFVHPIQVVLRLAPRSDPDHFKEIGSHPLIRVERSYSFDTDMMVSKEEIVKTVNLLRHTDVLVSVLSTLILESAYFNSPNISLRFPEFKSLYERDFITPIFETGGVRFVDDLNELFQAINRYLDDPSLDGDGRKMIIQKLCHGGDGRVRSRVLSEIKSLIKG